MNDPHALGPSGWMRRWTHLVPAGARVLDVACGSGRHVRWFAARGCRVVGVDRDAAAVEPLRTIADIVVADLERDAWPINGRFDAVVVANYLWRPLLPAIVDAVADGGVLLYETFAIGNETVGRPSNPDFLLRRGELLDAVRDTLRVLAFEDGFVAAPDRFVQRIAACREARTADLPVRYPLEGGG